MYGYNAAIKVKDHPSLSKLFFGRTVGFGIDLHLKNPHRSCFSLGLLVPLRSDKVNQYMNDLQRNWKVTFDDKLPDVGVSLEYKFVLD